MGFPRMLVTNLRMELAMDYWILPDISGVIGVLVVDVRFVILRYSECLCPGPLRPRLPTALKPI